LGTFPPTGKDPPEKPGDGIGEEIPLAILDGVQGWFAGHALLPGAQGESALAAELGCIRGLVRHRSDLA
jgi:hypothetical protein